MPPHLAASQGIILRVRGRTNLFIRQICGRGWWQHIIHLSRRKGAASVAPFLHITLSFDILYE